MIYQKKKAGLRIADIWFNDGEEPSFACDIRRYHYVRSLPSRCASPERLYTILIDLSRDEDALLSELDKTTKYQAKRAKERDDVRTETFISLGDKSREKLDQYIDFFNEFAKSKDRGLIDLADLESFHEAGTLCVRSVIDNKSGTTLSMSAGRTVFFTGTISSTSRVSESHSMTSVDGMVVPRIRKNWR